MKNYILKTLIAIFVVVPTLTYSQGKQTTQKKGKQQTELDRSVRPQAGPAPEINIGKYESFTLDNGLKVFVVENHKIPRVTYSLLIDYTPVQEGEVTGLADITGQLLRTGTKTMSKEQLDEEIDFIGASLSTSSNGMYASGLKKHNERLLQLMSDVLLNPSFNADELEKIRTRSISALMASKNEPSAISQRVSSKLFYGDNHPYGENMTEKSLKTINADYCKAFYSAYFKPQISYMAVVGDITLAEAKESMQKYFGNWQKGDVMNVNLTNPKTPSNTIVAIVDRPDAVQTTLSIGYPVMLQPGSEDAIKARVTNTILGGGTFRLFNNLREKHAFTYGAYSSLSADKYIGNFKATTEIRNSVTDSAVREILFEMNRLRTEPVPADELGLVKNYMSGNFALSLENPQTVANFAINTARYNLPADYYANYLKNLASVSADDVTAMAKKYIQPDNVYILAVGNASEILPKLEPFAGKQPIKYFDTDGNEFDPNKKLKDVPTGLTANEVVKKYIAAIGGEKAMSKVKDITINASTNMQGMVIGFDIYKKAPNKYMMKIGAGDMVFQKIVVNGNEGAMISPMGGENKKMEADELEDMKMESALFPELKYLEPSMKLNLEGIETIEGAEAYKVTLQKPSGKTSTMYYDVQSNLLIREISEQGVVEYSDYKAVNGIKFPYKIRQSMGPQVIDLNVLAVKINSKLSDDLFLLK